MPTPFFTVLSSVTLEAIGSLRYAAKMVTPALASPLLYSCGEPHGYAQLEVESDMESIDKTLDRLFPKTIEVVDKLTTKKMKEMQTAVRVGLPPDAQVEVSEMMNSLLLSVWIPGEGKRNRTCRVYVVSGATK